jgi:hypothetical protein
MGWAAFWAIFSQTHLVTLLSGLWSEAVLVTLTSIHIFVQILMFTTVLFFWHFRH